jgi:hypothetical protein
MLSLLLALDDRHVPRGHAAGFARQLTHGYDHGDTGKQLCRISGSLEQVGDSLDLMDRACVPTSGFVQKWGFG